MSFWELRQIIESALPWHWFLWPVGAFLLFIAACRFGDARARAGGKRL